MPLHFGPRRSSDDQPGPCSGPEFRGERRPPTAVGSPGIHAKIGFGNVIRSYTQSGLIRLMKLRQNLYVLLFPMLPCPTTLIVLSQLLSSRRITFQSSVVQYFWINYQCWYMMYQGRTDYDISWMGKKLRLAEERSTPKNENFAGNFCPCKQIHLWSGMILVVVRRFCRN